MIESIGDLTIKCRLRWLGYVTPMQGYPKFFLGWLPQKRSDCGAKLRWKDKVCQKWNQGVILV